MKTTLKTYVCGYCGYLWRGESGDHCPMCKHKREKPKRDGC